MGGGAAWGFFSSGSGKSYFYVSGGEFGLKRTDRGGEGGQGSHAQSSVVVPLRNHDADLGLGAALHGQRHVLASSKRDGFVVGAVDARDVPAPGERVNGAGGGGRGLGSRGAGGGLIGGEGGGSVDGYVRGAGGRQARARGRRVQRGGHDLGSCCVLAGREVWGEAAGEESWVSSATLDLNQLLLVQPGRGAARKRVNKWNRI